MAVMMLVVAAVVVLVSRRHALLLPLSPDIQTRMGDEVKMASFCTIDGSGSVARVKLWRGMAQRFGELPDYKATPGDIVVLER